MPVVHMVVLGIKTHENVSGASGVFFWVKISTLKNVPLHSILRYNVDREIFVLKIFRALKFHGAKFS